MRGMPRQIASSGASSSIARRSIERSSASACATDGGPANTPAAVIASGSDRMTRSLTKPGNSRNSLRNARRGDALRRAPVVRITERRLGDPRLVEGKRDAEQSDTPRERLLHCDCRSPA